MYHHIASRSTTPTVEQHYDTTRNSNNYHLLPSVIMGTTRQNTLISIILMLCFSLLYNSTTFLSTFSSNSISNHQSYHLDARDKSDITDDIDKPLSSKLPAFKGSLDLEHTGKQGASVDNNKTAVQKDSASVDKVSADKVATTDATNDKDDVFHTFYTGPHLFDPVRVENNLFSVASFIYTQDLHKTTFIFWVDNLAEKKHCEHNTVLGNMTGYGVQVRVFDWEDQVRGTVIANDTFYGTFNPHVSTIRKKQPSVYSDLVRLMVVGNYGGVWLDGDAWLIRSFADIFATREEFVPKKGQFNWHVFRLIKGSPLAKRFYQSLLQFPYDPFSPCQGRKQGSTKSPLCQDMRGWPTLPTTGLHHYVYTDALVLHVYNHNNVDDPRGGILLAKPMALFDPAWVGKLGPGGAQRGGRMKDSVPITPSDPYYTIHTRWPKVFEPIPLDDSAVGIAIRKLTKLIQDRACYLPGKECFTLGPKHLYA